MNFGLVKRVFKTSRSIGNIYIESKLMKCTSIVWRSHLKKWLGFAEKSLKSHNVNSDELSNGAELANKRGMIL